MYFIRYKTEQTKEHYEVPDALRNKLLSLGVEILLEAEFFPDIVARIPEDKIKEVESLEEVINIFDDMKFKTTKGDC